MHLQNKDLQEVGDRQDKKVLKVGGVHPAQTKDPVVGVPHLTAVGDRQVQWMDGVLDQEMVGDRLKETDLVDLVAEEVGGDQGN